MYALGWSSAPYQFRSRGDGNCVVYALPAQAVFPEPSQLDAEPPQPPAALAQPMDAISGDNSAWSYLAAALFRRELAESGAVGHGVQWLAYTILGADPWANDAKTDQPEYLGPIKGPSDGSETWHWTASKPTDWRPNVAITPRQITVTFFTFCGMGTERITQHTETYAPGHYSPTQVDNQVIGEGRRGYVL